MSAAPASANWRDELTRQLPLLGHRNWIVMVDSAYPWQTSPGIETVCTGAGQLTVVKEVLAAVEKAPHVRAIIYTDAELGYVEETHAPGIDAYREGLKALLGKQSSPGLKELPHEEIIALLDEESRTFRILLLKTTMTLPYTSVFLQLDCGYWSELAERGLRDSFRPK